MVPGQRRPVHPKREERGRAARHRVLVPVSAGGNNVRAGAGAAAREDVLEEDALERRRGDETVPGPAARPAVHAADRRIRLAEAVARALERHWQGDDFAVGAARERRRAQGAPRAGGRDDLESVDAGAGRGRVVPHVERSRGSEERFARAVALGLERAARRAPGRVRPERFQARRDPRRPIRLLRVRVVDALLLEVLRRERSDTRTSEHVRRRRGRLDVDGPMRPERVHGPARRREQIRAPARVRVEIVRHIKYAALIAHPETARAAPRDRREVVGRELLAADHPLLRQARTAATQRQRAPPRAPRAATEHC